MMAATLDRDTDTASGAADAPHLRAAARNVHGTGRASSRQRPLCEVQMGNLNVRTMEGKALEVVEMMKRRKMEVLCVQVTKWKGGSARKMAERYKMLHAGGDGRSNGVGIIVNVEFSKEVVRAERWQGRIIAVWMIIRQQMVSVICDYEPQTGRTEEEDGAFREDVERLAGLSGGQAMLFVAGDFIAHIGVVEPGDEESTERFGWRTRNREGRKLVEVLRRNGLADAGTFFQKKDSHKITYRSGWHQTARCEQSVPVRRGG